MTSPAAASTDQYGERVYRIPLRETGEIVERPSITRCIGLLASFGLDTWKLKMSGIGVAMRPDIAARVIAGHHMEPGKARNQQITAAVKDAIDVGQVLDKGWHAADFGTAVHGLSESIDAGLVNIADLPPVIKSHAERYADTMAAFGIEIVGSEISVYSDEHLYGGTIDRFVRILSPPAELSERWAIIPSDVFALDLKTGSVYEKAAMQLAAAVNAEGTYDATAPTIEEAFGELPAYLRKDIGFILQIADAGPAKLIPVELAAAWPAFAGACACFRFLATKPLGTPLKVSGDALNREEGTARGNLAGTTSPDAGAVEDVSSGPSPAPAQVDPFAGLPDNNGIPQRDRTKLRAWIIDRMKALPPAGLQHLADNWPTDVPTLKASDDHTCGHLDAIDVALKDAERETGQPFPDPDPSPPPPVAADDPRIPPLEARMSRLPEDLIRYVSDQAKETHGIPRLSTGTATEDQLVTLVALIANAEDVHAVRLDKMKTIEGVIGDAAMVAACKAAHDHDPKFVGVRPRQWDVDRIDNIADALGLNILAVHGGNLVVDLPAELIGPDKKYKGRRELLADAKTIAAALNLTKPAKAEDALADPLLVAAIAVA